MAVRIDLTLDAANPPRLAEFWKLALGYVDEPPPPPFATRADWLAAYGDPGDAVHSGAWLCDPGGVGPDLSILAVPEPKVAKNRLHMDVRVSSGVAPEGKWDRIRETVARLTEAGATVQQEYPGRHVVMADPEGNEFCVC
jgi:hypothetical protein